MARKRFNAVAGSLSESVSTSDTTLRSDGLLDMPEVLAGNDYAAVTIFEEAPDGRITSYEVVHVLEHAAASDEATVQRGVEGTTAKAWDAGAMWVHAPTRRDFDDHFDDIGNPHNVTIEQIGAAEEEHEHDHFTQKDNPHNVIAEQVGAAPASHVDDKDNPHEVTAAQAGAAPDSHLTETNPHSITPSMIGAAEDDHDHGDEGAITPDTVDASSWVRSPVFQIGSSSERILYDANTFILELDGNDALLIDSTAVKAEGRPFLANEYKLGSTGALKVIGSGTILENNSGPSIGAESDRITAFGGPLQLSASERIDDGSIGLHFGRKTSGPNSSWFLFGNQAGSFSRDLQVRDFEARDVNVSGDLDVDGNVVVGSRVGRSGLFIHFGRKTSGSASQWALIGREDGAFARDLQVRNFETVSGAVFGNDVEVEGHIEFSTSHQEDAIHFRHNSVSGDEVWAFWMDNSSDRRFMQWRSRSDNGSLGGRIIFYSPDDSSGRKNRIWMSNLDLEVSGSISEGSSREIKRDIVSADGFDFSRPVKPYWFRKDTDSDDRPMTLGIIAEELPEELVDDLDGTKNVKVLSLVAYLAGQVNELRQRQRL